jgi:hypothetical protein
VNFPIASYDPISSIFLSICFSLGKTILEFLLYAQGPPYIDPSALPKEIFFLWSVTNEGAITL